nr:MAG: E2 protein [Leptonychotes weddellii papillomavirus 8]
MMETLSQRLGVLQDQMMDLYEEQASTLSAQVKYWALQRQEHAVLYVAKQKGLNKLGHSAVPPMHVSKARAEAAIQMHLKLCDLQESQYATLPWTLRETSLERFKANPTDTFKKEGTQVTVHYDNSAENAVEYTLWGSVFDQVDGVWTKCDGGADELGLYISRNGGKEYYEDFKKDSDRYGTSGAWTVNCGNQTYCFPNSSGPNKLSIPDAVDTAPQTSAPSTQRTREASTDQPPVPGERPCAKEVELDRGRGQGKPTAAARGRKRLGEPLERDPDRRPRPYKVAKGSWRYPVSLLQHQQQQQQQQQQEQQQQQQLQQLQQQLQQLQQQLQQRGVCTPGTEHSNSPQAPAPTLLPCVVLSGRPNQLKCLRYRLWQRFGGLVEDITTTWTWAKRGHRERESKISLVFKGDEQRTKFLGTACLPKGVTASLGMLPY